MLSDFRTFIVRGNVIDLAVGVAIGAAFTAVVTSFTENLLTPLLAIPGDVAKFADLEVTLSGATFRYGAVIDAVISFLLVSAVLFFAVVRPVNKLIEGRKTMTESEAPTRSCPECLSSIPAEARRCAFCTAKVTIAA